MNFPRISTKTVENLIGLLKTRIQRCLAIGWISEDSRPKPLENCLKFPRFKTKTVGQIFEITETKSVRTSQDWKPKPLSSCLIFLWPNTKTVGRLFESPTIKSVGQLIEFSNHYSKALGSCLNFWRPETKTFEQLFELPMTQHQNRTAVVWTSLDQKCWAVVWISQESRPKPLRSCLNCPRLKTKTVVSFVIWKTKIDGHKFAFPKIQN